MLYLGGGREGGGLKIARKFHLVQNVATGLPIGVGRTEHIRPAYTVAAALLTTLLLASVQSSGYYYL